MINAKLLQEFKDLNLNTKYYPCIEGWQEMAESISEQINVQYFPYDYNGELVFSFDSRCTGAYRGLFTRGSTFVLAAKFNELTSNSNVGSLHTLTKHLDLVSIKSPFIKNALGIIIQLGVEKVVFSSSSQHPIRLSSFDNNGKHHTSPNVSINKIVRPQEVGIVNQEEFDKGKVIWELAKDYTFIGESDLASDKDKEEVTKKFSQYGNVIKYDQGLSLEANNKAIEEANCHVIIPPTGYSIPIIGLGLYNQIQVRSGVGKHTNVWFNGASHLIKDVKELTGNNAKEKAVLIL